MSRSSWKPPLLYYKQNTDLLENFFIYKVYDRRQIITAEYLNNTVNIYNGIKFFELIITDKMLGYKFGEFAPTRKIPVHKKKKKDILKKKNKLWDIK